MVVKFDALLGKLREYDEGAGPQGAPGAPGVNVVPKGTWVAGVYAKSDGVEHLGSFYYANAATVAGDVPGVSSKWVLFVSKGAPGSPGPQGINGVDGVNGIDGVNGTDGDDGLGVVWKKAWVAGTYNELDAVSHSDYAWVANKDTTEEPSDQATDWDILFKGVGVDDYSITSKQLSGEFWNFDLITAENGVAIMDLEYAAIFYLVMSSNTEVQIVPKVYQNNKQAMLIVEGNYDLTFPNSNYIKLSGERDKTKKNYYYFHCIDPVSPVFLYTIKPENEKITEATLSDSMKKRITKAPTAGAVTVNFSEAGIFDIATTVGTVITAAVNVNHINSSKLIIATGAGAVSFPAGGNYIILSGEYEVNKTNYIYIHCIDTTTPKFLITITPK